MNTQRVMNITKTDKGHLYVMAEKREQYVSYLHQYEHDSHMDKVDQMNILEWTKTMMVTSFKI